MRCSLASLFSWVLVRITFDTDKHFGFTGIRQGDWRGNTRVGRECELCKLSSLLQLGKSMYNELDCCLEIKPRPHAFVLCRGGEYPSFSKLLFYYLSEFKIRNDS